MSRLRTWVAPEPDALGASAEAFLARLDGPTILHVPGRDRGRARVVVTLLHGNEPSGLRAVHAWIARGVRPAVDFHCIVASVEAARLVPELSHRLVPGQRDLNRCFRPPYDDPAGRLAAELLGYVRELRPEALVDLHNNTGHNPPYSVASVVDPARLHLTWQFGSRLVHSNLQLGALTEVLAGELPAVTIECGRAGDASADATALAGLTRFASTERFDWARPAPPVQVFEHPLRVALRAGATVAFGDGPVPGRTVTFAPDADRHNFSEVPEGTRLGWADPGAPLPLRVCGDDGRDVAQELFRIRDGVLETRRPVVPIMMTTDPAIAVQDCLCYLVDQR